MYGKLEQFVTKKCLPNSCPRDYIATEIFAGPETKMISHRNVRPYHLHFHIYTILADYNAQIVFLTPKTISSGDEKESHVRHFFVTKGPNEAMTCKLEVKRIVTMAKGDTTFIWILTLTINEKQC